MTHVFDTCYPNTYVDAKGWEHAMSTKMDSLLDNHTWDLVPRLQRKNNLEWQWVYKTKFTFEGVVEHHKAELVVKIFSQQESINYTDTFDTIAKMIYVQVILSLVARLAWKIHQMNVKSTFLHGDLSEEIYMEQPPSFMTYSTLV